MEIQRVDIWSAARTMGALYAAFGVIAAVFFVPMMLLSAAVGLSGDEAGMALGAMGLIGSLAFAVMMPVFYGLMGMLGGALMALIDNLVARTVGGLEIKVRMIDAD